MVVSLIGSGIHTTLCTSILDGDPQQESRVPPDLPHRLGLQRHPASRTAQVLGSGLSLQHGTTTTGLQHISHMPIVLDGFDVKLNKLQSSEMREPQLRQCLHKTGLRPACGGTFLISDRRRKTPLTAGRWSWTLYEGMLSKPVSSTLLRPLHRPLPPGSSPA